MGRPVRVRTVLDRKFTGTRSLGRVFFVGRISDKQAKKSRIPFPNFGESRFPGIRQISNPVKIFCVFPNPAPDPENTLADLDLSVRYDKGFAFCRSILS